MESCQPSTAKEMDILSRTSGPQPPGSCCHDMLCPGHQPSHRHRTCRKHRKSSRWTSCHIVLPVIIMLQFLLTYAQGQGHGGTGVEEGLLPPVDDRVMFEVEEEKDSGSYVGTISVIEGLTYRFSEEPPQFSLDAVTGEIKTKIKLDRETLARDTFDLFVQSYPSARHLVEVKILVLDINDNSPVFGQSSIEVTFSERDQPGSQAILDTATDADTDNNDVTTNYEIISGNEQRRFRLVLLEDTSIPLLYLENTVELNREERDAYQLRISVHDGGTPRRYGYLMVNITVRDFNDNHPVFDQSYYSVQMNETSPPGSTVIQVQATDQDIGPNGDITYSVSTDDFDQFAIDPLTGILTTTKLLQCQHTCSVPSSSCKPNSCFITVEAKDKGGLSGRAYVTVNLMDENDHDPAIRFRYFSQLPYATVDESASRDDIVAFVSVTDQDNDINGKTTVRIVKGNELGHFRLQTDNRTSNVLSVVGPIDREQISKYNLTFEARDHGTPPRKSSSYLVIMVNDINDHAPVFQQRAYHSELSELVPAGSFVASITALDNDTGVNADITYTIVSGNALNWFQIHRKTGLVTSRASLDRETTSRIVLQVEAADGAADSLRVLTNLTIVIWDENDETPTFTQTQYQITLIEGAQSNTEILTVRAVDNDEGRNGSVTYSFTQDTENSYPGLLYLNQVSGRISLARELDREEYPEVVIKVTASDRGQPSLSSTCTITVEVADLNDNSPIFYPKKYYATVRENQPGDTMVVQVSATDPDAAENGTIQYGIQDGFMKFSINIVSGLISTRRELDREERSSYTLTITARDSRFRWAAIPATVEVTVADVQDTPPVFSQSVYGFGIVEDDSRSGSVVTGRTIEFVSATTPDQAGVITYAITGGDPEELFSIDQNTGELKTSKAIDREHQAFYQLHVTAIGGPVFGEATVNISILDVNDNVPIFQNSLVEAYVVENWPVGHSVHLAKADDPDDGDNGRLSYSLMPDSSPVFKVNPDTGMVYLASSLQYVEDTSFEVRVLAKDHGSPVLSRSQRVTIALMDVNDHTPQFEHSAYEVSVNEAQPVNDRFFRVIATDGDYGINGDISYAIVKGNVDNSFGIFPDGILYIAQTMDRESKDIYVLTVRARDGGIDPRESHTNVTIRVLDANDNAPHFINSTFNFYLQENSRAGSSVGIVAARDMDIGLNAEISYRIDGEPKGFTVHPKTGVVTSVVVFDREQLIETSGLSDITIIIAATDAGLPTLFSETDIHIYITDVNDNSPIFQQLMYDASIPEGASLRMPIVRVSASDSDMGKNAHITYVIIRGNEAGKFGVDSKSGQISLTGRLDREMVDDYRLTVVAMDDGNNSLNASCQVHVTVEDTNDNAPIFTQMITSANVLETAEVSDLITRVSAVDQDYANNAFLTYKIVAGNVNTTFRIDANDGRIFLAGPLDYEKRNIYHLNVSVNDAGDPELASSILITVHVLDYNDNAPKFPAAAIIRSIQEGVLVGTTVTTIQATDPDHGNNGELRYSIKSQDPPGNHFKIDAATGLIETNSEIDREFAESFELHIMAVDQAEPASSRKSAEKVVTIMVGDINDNSPKFVSMNAVPVMLGAQPDTLIITVRAEDPDDGANGEVTYEIVSGQTNLFRIDSVTGKLYLKSILNNQVLTYDLTIRARDRGFSDRLGQKSTTSQLTIFTKSSSEAGPQFMQTSYSGQVRENESEGTSVTTVTATYSARPAAEVVYYLTSIRAQGQVQDRLFQVNPTTGVISTTEPLDREKGYSLFHVEVYAVDRSSSTPQNRKVMIQITLLDTNDNPPQFAQRSYQFEVSEDVSTGYEISTLVATDADEEGTVHFSITDGGDGKFFIDPEKGTLRVIKKLDRENASSYNVKVSADDGKQSSVAVVTIHVTDDNDESPQFDRQYYYFDVYENVPTSSTIGQVFASDADEGQNAEITYSLSSYWGREKFSVHHSNGIFTLAGELDYEEVEHYVLTVKAQDGGAPSLSSTATVYVNILDINDNAPMFDPSSYSISVWENATLDTSVLSLAVTDLDSGDNGRVKYSITSGDANSDFRIDPDEGILYVNKELDCETKYLYFLEVQATDQAADEDDRLYGTSLVTILLLDVNDNAPTFTSPSEITVSEVYPPYSPVFTIEATDPDQGVNQYILYYLDQAGEELFVLDRQEGTLRTKVDLDREGIPQYVVGVTARDQGIPPLSSTMSLTVNVGDYNDHSPVFDPETYQTEVAENIKLGTIIHQVFATDGDIGINAEIRFMIQEGDDNHDFFIDSHVGEIIVQQRLDYERKKSYNLVIVAQDLGEPTNTDTATVSVTVTDINDCIPVFIDSPYLTKVQENTQTLPVHVVEVSAQDEDSTPNGQLLYSILSEDQGPPIFQINATTGIISAHQTLDREARDRYELLVTASDSGWPRLTGTGLVTVMVDDDNDNDPVFKYAHYLGHVLEDVPVGTEILQVHAVDKDDEKNAEIRYSLQGGNDKFSINEISGHVTTHTDLDREVQDHYTLVAVATDQGTIPRSSTVSVTVSVLDVNDEYPTFVRGSYRVYIRDPTPADSFVVGVLATDDDLGDNGDIVYTFQPGDTSSLSIDSQTGVITAQSLLSSNTAPSGYSFRVKASDKAQNPLIDEVQVTLEFLSSAETNFPTITGPHDRDLDLSENTYQGAAITTVTATTPKPGASLSYHLAGGNTKGTFAVHSETGEVTVLTSLDHEAVTGYDLWIEARDNSAQPLSDYVKLQITVLDENDNYPTFDLLHYAANVTEEAGQLHDIIRVTATDRDSGDNGRITYAITDGNSAGSFSIDPDTGYISTETSLDRETQDVYQLAIVASDQGDVPKSASATVDITVLDINDNPPIFSQLFSADIPEHVPTGYVVIKITSTDEDIYPNNVHLYSLDSHLDKFAINSSTGELTVVGELDREIKDSFRVSIKVWDGIKQIGTHVTVDIQDINDNAPIFDQGSYQFDFVERQPEDTFIGTVHATDHDASGSPSSQIYYRLKDSSEFFKVDAQTGQIKSRFVFAYKNVTGFVPLQPENIYHVKVLAIDQGDLPLHGEVTVSVRITPANEHSPVFDKHDYVALAPENALIGKTLIQLSASDDDFGSNAEVEYIVMGGNGSTYISLNSSTGWLSVASSLSGLASTEFVINVKAQDKGTPSKSTTTEVALKVTEINHFSPVFAPGTQFSVTVPEDQGLDTIIAQVSATDDDSGNNGLVSYFITGGDPEGQFTVYESSGHLQVKKTLDFETRRIHYLNVTARDRGLIPRETTKLFTVFLTDINDSPPQFEDVLYTAAIEENSPSGSLVLDINATDADTEMNSVMSYSLQGSGQVLSKFTINDTTGMIRCQGTIDYEEEKRYTATVHVRNPSTPLSGSTEVLINVLGVNEFVPVFSLEEYEFVVSESAAAGNSVGMVTANDLDHGEDGIVSYYLIGDSNMKGFAINTSSGAITISSNVDREATAEIILDVLAKNHGPIHGNDTAQAKVRIIVRDANDPPQFTQSLYEGGIKENALVSSSVLRVSAFDNDILPADRLFQYTILSGNDDLVFRVDSDSGWVTTLKTLDRETLDLYTVVVGAVDTGTPPKTGTATVKVTVEDINDNGPHFDPTIPVGSILEEQLPYSGGAVILKDFTEDADLPPNKGPYSYTLLDHRDVFDVTSGGEVKSKVKLDRENQSDYQVKVKVEDGGQPRMSSTLTFSVKVGDLNDNPSSPRPLDVVVYAYDGKFPGGKVADVKPLDPDTTGNYNCNLMGGDVSLFSIPNACDLHTTLHQDMSTFNLNLVGSDGVHSTVNYQAVVKFDKFDAGSVSNSIVVRLSDTTAALFLENSYNLFLQALSGIFVGTDKEMLFAVEQPPDSNIINLFIAVATDSGYRPKNFVAQKIKENEVTIENDANVDIAEIIDNPCTGESSLTCENDGVCGSETTVSEVLVIHDSSRVVFTSPRVQQVVKCTCAEGFEGEECDVPVNACKDISPCYNGGSCVYQGPGDYVCLCPPSWTGAHCDADVDECSAADLCKNGASCDNTEGSYVCHCMPQYTGPHCDLPINPCGLSPCRNGGTCVENVDGTYTCRCLFGDRGQDCEVSSKGFQVLSYVEYSLQLQPDENKVIVEFSTTSSEALLLYYPAEETDFLALEIVAGSVRFTYRLGEEPETRVSVPRIVSDGTWYRAEATRKAKVGSLRVTQCRDGQTDCDPCPQYDQSCYRESTAKIFEILDSSSSDKLHIAGVLDISYLIQNPGRVSTHDFVGCMRHLHVDNVALLEQDPLTIKGVTEECSRAPEGTCSVAGEEVCKNGGQCTDEWYDYRCSCADNFAGETCDKDVKSFSFGQSTTVTYHQKESYRRDQMMNLQNSRRKRSPDRHVMSVSFITQKKEGVLFFSKGNNGYMQVYIMNGKVSYRSHVQGSQSDASLTVDTDVANSQTHNVTFQSSGTSVTLSVDDTYTTTDLNGPLYDPLGLDMIALTLGGIPEALTTPGAFSQDFEGCLNKFEVDGGSLPLDGATDRFNITPSGDMGYDCPLVTTGGPPIVAIIVIVVFFVIVLIVILIVFIILRKRKRDAKKEATGSKLNGSVSSKSNGPALDKTSADVGNGQDSGFGEIHDMSEEAIIRQHVADEMTRNRTSSRASRPDVVVPDVTSMSVRPGDVVIENNGIFNEGYTEEPPEHYDIDNASSIAPSDLVDVVSHYRKYRSGQLNHDHHHHNHHHHHSRNPRGPGLPPVGPYPHHNKHPHSNRHHTSSPGSLLDKSHDSLTTVSRQSPISMSSQRSASPAIRNPHAHGVNNLNRLSPLDHGGLRQSPASNIPVAEGRPPSSLRSTPLSGISGLYPNSTSSTYSERPPPMVNGQGSGHPNSRVRQPITQIGLRGTPNKGLTVDDIHRLNTHNLPSPSMDALSSSSEEEQLDNKINRTDFTHADLFDPPSLIPPESSSEESANDSFTCSEFEFDNDRMRNDFTNPHRLVPRLSRVNEGDDTDSRKCSSHGMSDSNRDDSFSTFFTSEDEMSSGKAGSKNLPPKALNLDYLLNWGPNFEKLVGVFSDIAQLPDADTGKSASSSRPSSRGSPKPTSPFPKAPTPSSPMPVIIEDSNHYQSHNGYDSNEAIFDNQVSEEYV